MTHKLEEKIKNLKGNPNVYDISLDDDPIAKKTSWSAVKSLECKFRTHSAEKLNDVHFIFRATNGAKLFYLIFMMAGFGTIAAIVYRLFVTGPMVIDTDTIMLTLIGLIFASIGAGMFYFWASPMNFDKTKGMFWTGKKPPQHSMDGTKNTEHSLMLKDIYALQILAKYCRGKHKSIKGYELNLVLSNAERIQIVSHTNLVALRDDAAMLAEFLAISLWDVVKD